MILDRHNIYVFEILVKPYSIKVACNLANTVPFCAGGSCQRDDR